MLKHAVFTSVVALGLLFAVAGAADEKTEPKLPPAVQGKVDFDADIKPILAERCVKCHGPLRQKGGLRLDNPAHATEGGNTGAVIVPGKSAESHLIHALAEISPYPQMPPGKNQRLTDAEIGKFRAWIDQGAKWNGGAIVVLDKDGKSNHWAFQPIVKPIVPGLKVQPANPIDAFVLAKLEGATLAPPPSPEADRATLIRRVVARPHRTAADAGRGGCVPEGHCAERLRAGGRAVARQPALRRAVGPPLARRGPLRRQRRVREGHRPPVRVAVPRLGDRRAERRHAVRPLHGRATRRRPAPERDRAAEDGDRLPPQHADEQGGRASIRRSSASRQWWIA